MVLPNFPGNNLTNALWTRKWSAARPFPGCSPGNIPPVFFTYMEAFREKVGRVPRAKPKD